MPFFSPSAERKNKHFASLFPPMIKGYRLLLEHVSWKISSLWISISPATRCSGLKLTRETPRPVLPSSFRGRFELRPVLSVREISMAFELGAARNYAQQFPFPAFGRLVEPFCCSSSANEALRLHSSVVRRKFQLSRLFVPRF